MGRAQKFKEIRKREREESKIKKQNKKTRIIKSFVFILIFGLSFGGFSWGYSKLSNNNNNNNNEEETVKEVTDHKTEERVYSKAPDMQIEIEKEYTATIKTNKGEFKVNLYTKDAPKTVNNFVTLARDKFYDGLIFHRVIKDFMIQGGDPNRDGTGDPGYKFEDEFNDHKLVKGVLAMANSGPDTNGSQFFVITAEATDWLDGKHTPFGEVIEGIDVVMEIDQIEVGESDMPVEDVVIESIIIEEK